MLTPLPPDRARANIASGRLSRPRKAEGAGGYLRPGCARDGFIGYADDLRSSWGPPGCRTSSGRLYRGNRHGSERPPPLPSHELATIAARNGAARSRPFRVWASAPGGQRRRAFGSFERRQAIRKASIAKRALHGLVGCEPYARSSREAVTGANGHRARATCAEPPRGKKNSPDTTRPLKRGSNGLPMPPTHESPRLPATANPSAPPASALTAFSSS